MLYTFPIVIPANTPEPTVPTRLMPMTLGTITRVLVDFPAGHIGLTHVRIRRGLYQVWPANPEAYFTGSNQTLEWLEAYKLDTPPFQLEAFAWNLDDTYQHTITIHFELETPAVEQSLLSSVKQLLGLGA